MNKTILFVDDETQILRSLKRIFIGSSYTVFTAESGVMALEILNRVNINLIVTDVLMPGIDGYQLLKEVKDKYPNTIRLVLSGYADGNTLLKIQQRCLAKLYLFKPWQNQELTRIIENVFSIEELLKSKNVLEVINKIDFLPLPVNIYNKFNILIEQDADMQQIALVIESAPSIAVKVLQVANSALYGKKIGSVKQAITYLGLLNVKNIILTASLYNGLNRIENPYLKRDLNVFWLHSVTTNNILSFLYERLFNKKVPDTCATAGLLHDIGKVILLSNYPDKYLEAVNAIDPNRDKFYYEEMEFLEVSHSEIGGYLLSWWELPYPIVETALFHHNPLDERVIDKEVASLVHIANVYSWNIMFRGLCREIDSDVLKLFNLTQEDSNNLFKEIEISHI